MGPSRIRERPPPPRHVISAASYTEAERSLGHDAQSQTVSSSGLMGVSVAPIHSEGFEGQASRQANLQKASQGLATQSSD